MFDLLNKYYPFIPVVVLLASCVFLSQNYIPQVSVVLLFGIAATLPFIRQSKENLVKIGAYLSLGISAYILVGLAYSQSYISSPDKFMFADFYPVFIFTIANTIAILITTEDKDRHGYAFACGAFTVLFSSGLYTMGKQYGTLLLILVVLWTSIPLILCRIFSKQIFPTTTIGRRIGKALFGVIATYPLYFFMALLTVLIVLNQIPVNSGPLLSIDLSEVLDEVTSDPRMGLISVLYIFYNFSLPHLIFIPSAYMAYKFIFHDALGYKKRIVRETKEIVYEAPKKKTKKESKEETRDPYQSLLNEIKSQMSAFKNITNRVGAYQLMQRYKNEYNTLHTKYGDTATGMKVRDTLQMIEEKFRAQYK